MRLGHEDTRRGAHGRGSFEVINDMAAERPWFPLKRPPWAVLRKRPVLLVRRPEAQGGPGVVDGYLPDRLHALIGQGGDEPVAVQVGAELAAAHPQTVGAVLRKILRQPHFTWADHGEALLRWRKPWYYEHEPRHSQRR